MTYKLNGKTLAVGIPFSHNSINYPSNWLRLTTLDEKKAIGITEEEDKNVDTSFDARFYLAKDKERPLAACKTRFISEIKPTASDQLYDSDWMCLRAAEGGTAIPTAWKTYRANIRTVSNTRESEINAADSIAALRTLIDDNKLTAWPTKPS